MPPNRYEAYSKKRNDNACQILKQLRYDLDRSEEARKDPCTAAKIHQHIEKIQQQVLEPYREQLNRQSSHQSRAPHGKLPKPGFLEDELLKQLTTLEQLTPLKPKMKKNSPLCKWLQEQITNQKCNFLVMKHCTDCIGLWFEEHDPPTADPFSVPCSKPHLLVYSERDSYLWPAKLISIQEDYALLNYFGPARFVERVPLSRPMLLTEEHPQPELFAPRRGRIPFILNDFRQAMRQLQRHIQRLDSLYADSPMQVYHDSQDAHKLAEYVATYGIHLVKRSQKTPSEVASEDPPNPCPPDSSESLDQPQMGEASINVSLPVTVSKILRKQFLDAYISLCSRFSAFESREYRFAKREYKIRLSKIKREIRCSFCKNRRADIELSLKSHNGIPWHPYRNNYAYCSEQCKLKSRTGIPSLAQPIQDSPPPLIPLNHLDHSEHTQIHL